MKQAFLTQKGPKAVGPYSTCVIAGNTAYMSGMIGINPAVGAIEATDTEGQARQVFENISTVLGEMGMTLENVVKVNVFMTDLSEFAKVNAIYAEYFKTPYPARSCVEVSKLPVGALIEIEVIAVLG
ncbi:MAG: hypothetical protein E7335_00340 [Clostridiales bacterium]|nr:hypothetical protein [Clostridiales bacterium]